MRAATWIAIVLTFMMSGCVASYQHLSDPRAGNDGYDLLCGGLEYDIRSLRLRGDLCSNVAPNGGEFIHTSVEYRFGRTK
jgi:hypothetical protein